MGYTIAEQLLMQAKQSNNNLSICKLGLSEKKGCQKLRGLRRLA
jgi:hypothetical protein